MIKIQRLDFDIKKPLRDMLSLKVMLINLLLILVYILVGTCIITLAVINFQSFIGFFPKMWVDFAYDNGFLNTVVLFILAIFTWIVIFFLIFLVSNTIMLILWIFLAEHIVKAIRDKYYTDINLNPENIKNSSILSLKILFSTFLRLLVFIAISYVLTIIGLGFVSFFIMLFAYFRFYSKNINYQVASLIMNNKEYNLLLKRQKFALILINIFGYIISIIPILGQLFISWQVIALSHYILFWYQQNKNEVDNLYIQDVKVD